MKTEREFEPSPSVDREAVNKVVSIGLSSKLVMVKVTGPQATVVVIIVLSHVRT